MARRAAKPATATKSPKTSKPAVARKTPTKKPSNKKAEVSEPTPEFPEDIAVRQEDIARILVPHVEEAQVDAPVESEDMLEDVEQEHVLSSWLNSWSAKLPAIVYGILFIFFALAISYFVCMLTSTTTNWEAMDITPPTVVGASLPLALEVPSPENTQVFLFKDDTPVTRPQYINGNILYVDVRELGTYSAVLISEIKRTVYYHQFSFEVTDEYVPEPTPEPDVPTPEPDTPKYPEVTRAIADFIATNVTDTRKKVRSNALAKVYATVATNTAKYTKEQEMLDDIASRSQDILGLNDPDDGTAEQQKYEREWAALLGSGGKLHDIITDAKANGELHTLVEWKPFLQACSQGFVEGVQ